MVKKFLFKRCIPIAGFFSCLYWVFGEYESVYVGLLIGWIIIILTIIYGLKEKWFE